MKIGFLSMLAIVFITLKLCSVIEWSWWLVLLPLYGPIVAVIGLVILMAVVAILYNLFDGLWGMK